MFEELKLLGTGPRRLALQTRKGRDVLNEVALEPQPRHIQKYRAIRDRHPEWKNRKSCCGGYNCFGHVFAARRTAIYEAVEVEKILTDDGYRRASFAHATVGDLVLYRGRVQGIIHVGQIVEVVPGSEDSFRGIWVLSKWDDTTGEDRHLVHDVPFTFDDEIEIWTDLP